MNSDLKQVYETHALLKDLGTEHEQAACCKSYLSDQTRAAKKLIDHVYDGLPRETGTLRCHRMSWEGFSVQKAAATSESTPLFY